jgi:hypothetical protein
LQAHDAARIVGHHPQTPEAHGWFGFQRPQPMPCLQAQGPVRRWR